jgi:hypothetical protein
VLLVLGAAQFIFLIGRKKEEEELVELKGILS